MTDVPEDEVARQRAKRGPAGSMVGGHNAPVPETGPHAHRPDEHERELGKQRLEDARRQLEDRRPDGVVEKPAPLPVPCPHPSTYPIDPVAFYAADFADAEPPRFEGEGAVPFCTVCLTPLDRDLDA